MAVYFSFTTCFVSVPATAPAPSPASSPSPSPAPAPTPAPAATHTLAPTRGAGRGILLIFQISHTRQRDCIWNV